MQTTEVVLGVVGVGRIGRVHLENLLAMHGVRVKTVCDWKILVDKEMMEWAVSRGFTKFTTDYHEITCDPEISAILILSSTNSHVEISIAAAEAHKHIFCEKPVSSSLEEIETVRAAVQKSNVIYQVGFNRRFDHNWKALKQSVTNGDLGAPSLVKARCIVDPTYNEAYIRESAKEGGMLVDMTIHDFDMCNYLLSSTAGLPVSVYTCGGSSVSPLFKEVGDVSEAVVMIRYQSGATAIIDNSRETVYGYDQRVEIFGSKGCAIGENDLRSSIRLYSSEATKLDKIHFWFLERYELEFDSY
ncbi:inositol 2-dehydrogenase [Pelomyxa schiedti]|nr:inositol 2-dehydrogenase [Pelomyxa schiedti]